MMSSVARFGNGICAFELAKRRFSIHGKNTDSAECQNQTTITRIPDKDLGILGGKFHISQNDEEEFYSKYIDHVLINNNREYLTELQLNDGTEPILVDLDFRYPLNTEERKYTKEHITNLIDVYLDELPKIFNFPDGATFPVFVFERPALHKKFKKEILTEVKDGIHIIIGLQLAHKYQMLLRSKMMATCKKNEILTDLNLIKGLDDVFDDKISAGTSGWQIYGSTKPGCEPYEMTQYIQMTYDANDGQFQIDNRNVSRFLSPKEIYSNFNQIRARFAGNLKVELVPDINKMLAAINTKVGGAKSKGGAFVRKAATTNSVEYSFDRADLTRITNAQELDAAVNLMLNSFSGNETQLKDAHELTQILPEKYYKDGESHFENRLVAFALKNTDERLFLSWVMLRSKAQEFDFTEIPLLYEKWEKYFNVNGDNHTTIGSLIYWAKTDAPEEYNLLRSNNTNKMMEDLIKTYTDGRVARLLKNLFGDTFVCADIETKSVYMFEKHHWVEDRGFTIRKWVSTHLLPMFEKKAREAMEEWMLLSKAESPDLDNDLETDPELDLDTRKKEKNESKKMESIKKRMRKIAEVCSKLDSTNTKNNSFREALEIFYDPEFRKQLDTQKWLMGFSNGVLDMKNKVFRDGQATDYISLTTKIDYQPITYYTEEHAEKYSSMVSAIRVFFSQLFPSKSLEGYMWDHLGSVLIGERIEQVLNIYVGSGSNGKSLLVDLMKACMGDYKVNVPINMITGKRTEIGSATPETMALKGARYAVFQEPDKDSPLNEGYVKELTGESMMSGRPLFGKTEVFPLQVNFASCMNSLFEIKGEDDGIWRRLKVVKFLAKFVDDGEIYDHESPYVFKKDKTLASKLNEWAPIFMSMLVEIAFKNQGVVKDCEEVVRDTNEYRQAQNVILCFFAAKVEKAPQKCQIGVANLNRTFKEWYNHIYNNKNMPKLKELDTAMNKLYGDRMKNKGKKWNGVRIIFETEETTENANDNDNDNDENENEDI